MLEDACEIGSLAEIRWGDIELEVPDDRVLEVRRNLEWLTECAFEVAAEYDPRARELARHADWPGDLSLRFRSLLRFVCKGPFWVENMTTGLSSAEVIGMVSLPRHWMPPDEWLMSKV